MRLLTVIAFTLFMGASIAPASAFGCGWPPTDAPTLPDGNTAERADITAAIAAVQAFGQRINDHLNCLDEERPRIFLNMNKDQQERWTDDYNALIDNLSALETGLNEQIRIFNDRINADKPDTQN